MESAMDRQMRKALLSRGRYDWDTHEATRLRNREQIAGIPAPEYPATGTARIGALIAEARRQRDAALLAGAGDGAGGIRTRRPLDNVITPTRRKAAELQPAHTV
jgi:hypothetical protein